MRGLITMSCAFVVLASAGRAAAGEPPGRDGARDAPVVDPGSAFYSLNPSGDLQETQAAFEGWFSQLPGWEVRTAGVEMRGRGRDGRAC